MSEIFSRFLLVFATMIGLRYTVGLQRKIRILFRRFAAHKVACIVLTAILPIVFRLLLLQVHPPPDPGLHDEFSYLLASDTFAHGRMTNPYHPMWIHFETVHENFVPTYASKYPPAQGLFLAFGQSVFGHPWAGVLISIGLMCSSLCWMLQGWLPPSWAFLGALIGTINLGACNYWTESYWGGAVAAIGGSLVMGAYPRIKGRTKVHDAILFAIGVLLLANSRPFEGLVFVIPATISLIIWTLKTGNVRWLVPAALVTMTGLLVMGLYNYRVTGNVLLLPYQVNEKRYAVAPAFLGMPLRPAPHYNHEILRTLWAGWDVNVYNRMRTDLWFATNLKLIVFWQTFVRLWPLGVTLLVTPFLFRSRRARFPMLVVALFVGTLLFEKAVLPHYTAPIACCIYLIMMVGLHRIYLWKPDGRPTGRLVANLVLIGTVFVFAADLRSTEPMDFTGSPEFKARRRNVLSQLEHIPGSHLVLVRYQSGHDIQQEWVYNRADIDTSKIVWAREMGTEQDRPLIDYYPRRRVWRLEPDTPNVRLTAIR